MDTVTPVDELLFGLHATIERCGWMVMYVLGERRRPPWAYTIGLSHRCRHPELVVLGLDDRSSAGVLNRLATRVDAGERLDALPGGETVVDGSPCRIVPVHAEHWETDLFAAWVNYYGALGAIPDPAALQVVWADEAGRFPGDHDFDPSLRRHQRHLDRAPRARKPGEGECV
ncbi:MAG: DUF4262 domain-containing protein [Acidimicrobiia bacterium]